MKSGMRKFSANKRVSSRITGRGKRTIKRMVVPRILKKRNGIFKKFKKISI